MSWYCLLIKTERGLARHAAWKEEIKYAYRRLVQKSSGKNLLVRQKRRWIHNIKADQNKLAIGM
jgi:hypothetical protein